MLFLRGEKAKRSKASARLANGLQMESLEQRNLLASDFSAIADPFAKDAVTLETAIQQANEQPYVAGELIVATQLSVGKAAADDFLANLDWTDRTGVASATAIDTLMTVERGARSSVSLVHLDLGDGADVLEAMRRLDAQGDVLWSTPNFIYAGADPRDLIPNDPQFGSQYHHPLMDNIEAWDISLGDSNIVVGITDDGTDLQHQDLSTAIWTNPGEVPGDGIDNDGNGYIDDVNGYNFLNNNNNPDALPGDDHGTHVSGIVGATINNGIGVVGTAPGVTILPLKWYDGGTWTAAIIAATFTYAADNGANIVNTSYNMDSWATNPVVHAAFDYMYDAGVLHFNSAGNGGSLNPARQVFVESLLVASTESSDAKSSFSNYGDGVDVAAPGGSILSTTPNNTYSVFSGTSMASPNAAAVAALIWSANPNWTRDQVAAQLLATTDNIDAQNPNYVGLLGTGRVNSNNALTTVLGAPKIQSIEGLPPNGGILTTSLTGFDVVFSQVMDPASVNNDASYELRSAGFDGIFDTSDDDVFSLSTPEDYKIGTNQFHVDFGGAALGFGDYRLSLVSGGLQNPFGTPLDGNGDGTGGDNFATFFSIEPPPPVGIAPQGSLIYQQSFPDTIDAGEDTDMFAIDVDPGQTLTILIEGASSLTPTVKVEDPDGIVLADLTGSSNDVLAQVLSADIGGSYVVTIGAANDTSGNYSVTVLLNSAVEEESYGGPSNDLMSGAQDINGTSVAFAGLGDVLTADRLGVLGRLPSSDGTPVDGDDFESGALDSRWTTMTSNPVGRIQVSSTQGAAGGTFALLMDVSTSSTYSLNEAIWTADLTGINSPKLSFYHAEWGDEEQALPVTFTGSFNGDGVSISEDGVTWHRVFNPATQTTGQWVKQVIDLTTAANAAGISLGANFQVKFQQYDNFSFSTDGRAWDEIQILEPAIAADWYTFTLNDGQYATLGGTVASGAGHVNIELYDAGGTLLASGVGTDNVTSAIERFQDPTSNGGADSYYVRVTGEDAEYSLIVTRGATFDLESNDSPAEAQSLNGLQGVLGYTSTETEGGVEPDNYPAGSVLDTVVPGVTLSERVSGTSVYSATASFGAPTGTRVLAPGPTSASGWSDDADELRADFDTPTSFVSIDVGSDDSADVGFLRAYNAAGVLIGEVISGSVSTGGSQTISITRPTPDIAYIIASGLGGDITPLDNLRFGVPGSADIYYATANVGDPLQFQATLPAGGPFLFDNPLATAGTDGLVMELRDPSGVLVASGSESISHVALLQGDYTLTVHAVASRGEYFIAFNTNLEVPSGDFDGDGDYDCNDINALVGAIASGSGNLAYDLSGDGQLNTIDLNLWLAEAGAANLPSGNPYLLGDANLDGSVDGADFTIWNANKFTSTSAWCLGDFDADGQTAGNDFLLWNANKFTSSAVRTGGDALVDTATEPATIVVGVDESPAVAQAPIAAYRPSTDLQSDRDAQRELDREEAVDALFALM